MYGHDQVALMLHPEDDVKDVCEVNIMFSFVRAHLFKMTQFYSSIIVYILFDDYLYLYVLSNLKFNQLGLLLVLKGMK